jgi:membrane-bound lytic murein transglycosylase MltF
MKRIDVLALLLCVGFAGAARAADEAAPAPAQAPSKKERALSLGGWISTDDFDKMRERRAIRMLVPYGRTLFFHDKGEARGATVLAAHEFEKFLNKKYPDKRPFTVAVIPTTRDRLLPALIKGEGDIAAGNLTVTEARGKQVDFTVPTIDKVTEIVVTGPGAPELKTVDDLAGQQVHVRPTSSYHESLVALNQRFAEAGKPPMRLLLLPDELEDEDALDMINAGLIQIAVIDDWKGNVWAPYLPKVKLRPDLVVRDAGHVAWAVRKGNPLLKAEADAWISQGQKQGLDNIALRKAVANAKRMQNATASAEMKKFIATIDLFRKYGNQYNFDYLMLAAQGYQESRLDQNAKSHVGAIGIMQVMPATGKELKVGDIHQTENNVHAGSKYMAQLMERYFKDAKFDEQNRTLFAFAAYNAGPGNISKMRKESLKRGLDPDQWFNNVEIVTAEKIGIETTTYVRNIYKYYVSYKLALEAEDTHRKAREAVKPGA